MLPNQLRVTFKDGATADQGRSDGGYIGIYTLPQSVPENYFLH